MSARPRRSSTAADEEQYERHRSAVLALLRARFGSALNDVDREDLYHEAWAGVLEHRRRGQATPDLLGLLKTIAWRRGRDRLRNISADPADPSTGAVARAFATGPSPEDEVVQRLDADLFRELINALGERQRAIVKLRCEWALTPSEIQNALGISRKTYEKQLTQALKRLALERREIEDGRWRERQLELLNACESGTASAEDRARAARLIRSDPVMRALLRRLRGAAALAPVPLILLRRLARRFAPAVGQASASTGVAGPGSLTVSGAVVAKVAAACLAGVAIAGGATAALQHQPLKPRAQQLRAVQRRGAAHPRRPLEPATRHRTSSVPRAAPAVAAPEPPPTPPASPERSVPPPPAPPAADTTSHSSESSRANSRPRRPVAPRGDGSQEFGL